MEVLHLAAFYHAQCSFRALSEALGRRQTVRIHQRTDYFIGCSEGFQYNPSISYPRHTPCATDFQFPDLPNTVRRVTNPVDIF